jgi:zinc protease
MAPAIDEWAIDESTTGLLVEDHRAPLIFLIVDFPAGTWSPWVEVHDASTAFAIQMHDVEGALRRRANRLAATVWLTMETHVATLSLTCHRDDAPAAIELVRDVLANRDFDRAELRRRRQGAALAWKGSSRDPQFVLSQAAARVLYEVGDPRRRPFEKPTPSSIHVERLAAARDALIRLPGRVVGFAGDVTPEEARRLAQGLLPDAVPELPVDLAPRLGPIAAAERRPREVSVHLPRLTQVYTLFGRDSLSWRDADDPASLIADHALGGHFNSRLMVALRQEGGDTYGASVLNQGGSAPGGYGLGSFTRFDNAGALDAKLREVLARFHAEGITEDERAVAASSLVGERAFHRQSPHSILRLAMTERRHGLPLGFFDARAERAAALSLDEVNAFIRRFHDPAQFTMLTLRPE